MQGYYQEMLEMFFDYDINEVIELDGDKKFFVKDDNELKEYWCKYLKYEMVECIVNKIEEEEKKGEEEVFWFFEEIEQEFWEEVLEFLDDWYGCMCKLKWEDCFSVYFNIFMYIFDFYFEYYQFIDKENFNICFSGWLEGIGVMLCIEDDYIKVVCIVVGGFVWK